MTYQFNCPDVASLRDMIQRGRGIARKTFLRHVCRKSLLALEQALGYACHPSQGLTMAGDRHVGYFKSMYGGQLCVYITWSAIEYVFL